MEADGFVLGGFEGPARQAGQRNALPQPFILNAVRPDAWGIHETYRLFGFAEAKTSSDINTHHTRKQLRIFGSATMKGTGCRCPLYLAIPRSAAYSLDKVLVDVGLISASNLIRLHIPDALLKAA
jgi:hypothetical protein